ncbi:MAG: ABC transporter permease [Firmicutes bacterium]|nr:ABC transporter permease [Bacillota bacterium]MDD3298423.1 ABC transporter permease [Bacillota bacterium]MDD3852021.1 ABC transporter permease [Bacillota bacterium]MDD4707419.1 ABC transporter permease [Bacillota bacterium]
MTKNLGLINSIKPRIKEIRLSLYLLGRNRLTRLSLVVVILLILIALVAPYIVPYPEHIETETNPEDKLLLPSGDYFFGTDELGRDVFSRVLYGTRISLQTALVAVGLALLIGIPLGAIAGATGGIVDEIIMRITDIFLSFPPLLLAIAIAAFLGPSLENAMLAIAVSWWPWYTRLIRGQAVSIRERQFVKAARAIGTPPMKIVFGHIVPNCIAPVIVQASMDIGGVILTIASLSFLGLGAQPPTPEWGLMVSTSRNYFLNAWWYSIFPGLAIFVTVLVFNLLGDGLREILDPKTRKI